jgi:ketosteroid isomerase-like protein
MSTYLETVQSIYQAFGRGDVPAILSRLSPDVQWEQWPDNTAQRAGVPWLRAVRGCGRLFPHHFRMADP